MKLRFADQAIRCRATRAELAALLSGRAVQLQLTLPRDRTFLANVRPSALDTWQFDSDPTGLWLTIPSSELRSLSETLPSREGLQHAFQLSNGGTLQVSFEVDLRREGDRDGQKGIGDRG